MAIENVGTFGLSPVNGNFGGTIGLPGAATNNNPFGLASSTISDNVPSTGLNPLSDNANSVLAASPGIFSVKNLLSNASNAILGTNFSTAPVNAFGTLNSLVSPSNPTGAVPSSTSTVTWSDLFLRSVIIILGFIFVAVGLSMFKSGDIKIISDPLKNVKKTLKG